jgi:hypothetical protein
MYITDLPSIVNVSHDMFYAVKSKIYVGGIVHCKSYTTNNHNDQIYPLKRSKIPKVVQI